MANYLVTDTQLTSVADAIRAKTGQSGGLSFPSGMVSAVGGLSTGDHTAEDALLQGNMSGTYSNPRVTSVASYAFQYCTGLTKVELDACTSIGAYAFNGCSKLTEIWLGASNVSSVYTSSIPIQFSAGSGAIYVPANMVDSYRASSSWATWKWHIVSEDDYPVTNFDTIKDTLGEMCTKLANGTANYDVGDFKTIDLGTEGKIRMQVAAKNADALASGSGNAAYTWVAMDLLNTSHRMNPSLSGTTEGTGAIGGWGKSEMRTYLSTTIWALIPAELQAVIKEVKKYSCIYDTSSTKVANDETSDKLWIPSVHEVFNDTTYESQGPSYTGIFTFNSDRIRYKPGASSAYDWWERSAHSPFGFRGVYNNGTDGGISANGSSGVLLGFCT